MIVLLAPLISTLLGMSLASEPAVSASKKEQIRTLPVPQTPEPATVTLAISVPKNGKFVDKNPVWVQFRIDGYALGAASQFIRADELPVSKMGQTVHVVVDNEPYFPVNEPAIDPFSEDGFYYDMSFKFQLPFSLEEGAHTIRVFPARSYGESLKGDRAFHAVTFYLGSAEEQKGVDLTQPYLTYNEPSDDLYLIQNKPILLDFYITNTELSQDGYKVRLTIDGKMNRILTSWQPYYIYGLKSGSHTVKLELLDPSGSVVPGTFNSTERTITVH